jgi:hypothetical protein
MPILWSAFLLNTWSNLNLIFAFIVSKNYFSQKILWLTAGISCLLTKEIPPAVQKC